jgi:two-component sensor histidine kinase
LEDYMNELIFEIHSTYAHKKVEVDLTVDPTIDLDLDTAIPFGLILNELVTNAFKYGFPNDRENTLTVNVSNESDFYSLVVSDNGDGIVRKETEVIGLHLVKRLTKQLMGAFSCENENGGKFTVIFKDTAMRLN